MILCVCALCLLLATPHSLWDLSSPTRDGHCLDPGSESTKHWATRTSHCGSAIALLCILCCCNYMYIYYTYNIYHFNHSWVYNLMSLNTFKMLCDHHYLYLKLFHHLQQHLCTPWTITSHSLVPPASGHLYSIFCLYEFVYSRYLR